VILFLQPAAPIKIAEQLPEYRIFLFPAGNRIPSESGTVENDEEFALRLGQRLSP
jgi:hypothetical protein